MSEPYSPSYLDTLGIEYIKEDYVFNYNEDNYSKKRNLLKKKALLQVLANEINKRELKANVKVKKKLFV